MPRSQLIRIRSRYRGKCLMRQMTNHACRFTSEGNRLPRWVKGCQVVSVERLVYSRTCSGQDPCKKVPRLVRYPTIMGLRKEMIVQGQEIVRLLRCWNSCRSIWHRVVVVVGNLDNVVQEDLQVVVVRAVDLVVVEEAEAVLRLSQLNFRCKSRCKQSSSCRRITPENDVEESPKTIKTSILHLTMERS